MRPVRICRSIPSDNKDSGNPWQIEVRIRPDFQDVVSHPRVMFG